MNEDTGEYHNIVYKAEILLNQSKNRYATTMQVAYRAKRKRYEDIDIITENNIKPIMQTIIDMSDEATQPVIINE